MDDDFRSLSKSITFNILQSTLTQKRKSSLELRPRLVLSPLRFLFSHFNNATSSSGRFAESQVALPLRGHRSSSQAHSSLSRICVDSQLWSRVGGAHCGRSSELARVTDGFRSLRPTKLANKFAAPALLPCLCLYENKVRTQYTCGGLFGGGEIFGFEEFELWPFGL